MPAHHGSRTLHPSVERACQEIDASFFSGDQFESEEGLARIEFFLERWNKRAEEIRRGMAGGG